MEINIGSSVHYLDYRKNYMFSHIATTLKKKTDINFICRQNLKERPGDPKIPEPHTKSKRASVNFPQSSSQTLPKWTLHNADRRRALLLCQGLLGLTVYQVHINLW